MSLKNIYSDILLIKDTGSTNAKISILSDKLHNDEIFRHVIELMYSDEHHFKINALPPFLSQSSLYSSKSSNTELFNFLEKLSNQKGASNADKHELCRLASMDKETYEVVKKIVNKDAKAGFSGKTINSAYSGLLKLIPYARCSTEKKISNIDFTKGAIAQEKADGSFVNIIIDKEGKIIFRSRNGKEVYQMDHLHDFFKKLPKEYYNTVFMGELLIKIEGKILPRKTGNGILNKMIQNAAPSDKAKHTIIKLWDAIPVKDFWNGSCNISYSKRLFRAAKFVQEMGNKDLFSLITSKKVHSLKEAREFYKRMRNEGKEGAIIKNLNAKWKNTTSNDMIKLKNISDIELRIVGWKFGKKDTRFKDCLGSVQLASDDEKIFVSVSGFTDEERLQDWAPRIGMIATLEFEGLISDKSKPGVYSLYLPRNLILRPDRSDTDTLDDVQNR